VALAAEGWTIVGEPLFRPCEPDLWPNEFKPRERESMLASKIQFEVTTQAVEKWKPRYVILDGTILLNLRLVPGRATMGPYRSDYEETLTSVLNLLMTCYEENVPVVGFVKRTRLNRIAKDFGVQGVRDTAILDLILRQGQYTKPRPYDHLITKEYVRKAKELGMSSEFIKDCLSFRYAYIRTGLATPFRLEMPNYALKALPDVALILHKTSEEDGIPYAIHEVDAMTKVTNTLSNIRTLMLFSKAVELVRRGEFEPEDLNLLALQHGEFWVLRREGHWEQVEQESVK
jgi:hypothetical protein